MWPTSYPASGVTGIRKEVVGLAMAVQLVSVPP